MSDTRHELWAVFDVLGALYPYPVQDKEPVANQRRAKQEPEGTPSELREREDNNSDPKESQHETQPECTKEEDERECRDDE
jgi:hypothetical protein